ncbi:MAG: type II secretion system secretin GspD, partial [Verrucomicrobia bacterium]|nr:type II secretion system secretin GspD [Verrucomicrobiota bacterium]
MKKSLMLITTMLAAVAAGPVIAQAPATSEDAAAAALRIRASDLLRRGGGTNTLVIASAPVTAAAAPAAVPAPTVPQATPGAPGAPGAAPVVVAATTVPAAAPTPVPTAPPSVVPAATPAAPPSAPVQTAPLPVAPVEAAQQAVVPGPGPITLAKPSAFNADETIEFDWMNADLLQVLAKYSELTRRSPIMQQGLQALISFRSAGPLTMEEAVGALESVMMANGFAIVPMGEKFYKVVPVTSGVMEGVPVAKETTEVKQYDRIIAQIVRVKFLDAMDEQRALTSTLPVPGQPAAAGGGRVFMHPSGQIIAMPRSNALLIIDSALNVSRLKDIIEYMDTTSESKMETRVYVLENAAAIDLASILQQLIAADQGGTTARVGTTPMPMPQQGTGRAATTGDTVILGKVLTSYDDRTNALIIITQESNFSFFEKIIKALDVKTNQDFKTRVFFLNYSDALDMSDMLVSLIQGGGGATPVTRRGGTTGGTTGGTSSTARRSSHIGGGTRGGSGASRSGTSGGSSSASRSGTSSTRSTGSRSGVSSRSTFGSGQRTRGQYAGTTGGAAGGTPGVSPTGAAAAQLQPQIKIIPDVRNNAVIVSAPEADLDVFADVIKQLDIFPPQVAIDVVVAEVSLNNDVTFGVDLFQSAQGKNPSAGGVSAPGGFGLIGNSTIGQTTNAASGISSLISAGSLTAPELLPAGLTGGLTYFASFFGDDLRAVIHALAEDNKFKVLQTPHLYTSNNQRARIFVGESRPFVTSVQQTINSEQVRSNFENIDIGVGLEVTPLINPDGVVTLNIFQTVDDVKEFQIIDNNQVPVLSRREAEAVAVTVKDGQIIILGGLTANKRQNDISKVPLLGDIPLLGNLFKTTHTIDARTELVFFLRP